MQWPYKWKEHQFNEFVKIVCFVESFRPKDFKCANRKRNAALQFQLDYKIVKKTLVSKKKDDA